MAYHARVPPGRISYLAFDRAFDTSKENPGFSDLIGFCSSLANYVQKIMRKDIHIQILQKSYNPMIKGNTQSFLTL